MEVFSKTLKTIYGSSWSPNWKPSVCSCFLLYFRRKPHPFICTYPPYTSGISPVVVEIKYPKMKNKLNMKRSQVCDFLNKNNYWSKVSLSGFTKGRGLCCASLYSSDSALIMGKICIEILLLFILRRVTKYPGCKWSNVGFKNIFYIFRTACPFIRVHINSLKRISHNIYLRVLIYTLENELAVKYIKYFKKFNLISPSAITIIPKIINFVR